jgi:hypothetical protein
MCLSCVISSFDFLDISRILLSIMRQQLTKWLEHELCQILFVAGATESSTVKMVDDNSKPWQAAVETNGVGTLLGNSVGQLIPSGVESPLLNPVQIEERYSLAG